MAHPLINKDLDFGKANALVGLSDYEGTFVPANKAYYYGDHWQEGNGYIGPRPSIDDPRRDQLWDLLSKSFVSKNIIKEIVDRQVAAVLGNQPDWNLTVRRALKKIPKKIPDPNFIPDPLDPSKKAPLVDDPKGRKEDEPLEEAEQQLIDEGMAALAVLWDKRKPLKKLREMLRNRCVAGRGYLRSFVPPKFRDPASGTIKGAKDLQEAIQRVFFDAPDPAEAVVEIDPESQDSLGLIRFTRGAAKAIEVSFVDDSNQTFIGVLQQGEADPAALGAVPGQKLLGPAPAAAADQPAEAGPQSPLPQMDLSSALDLAGHLPVYEAAGDPLITDQIRANNALVNLSLTMCAHVLVESGFSELIVTNVEFEMVRVPDPASPSGYREVPKALKRGGGAVQNLVGIQTQGPQGQEQIATPGIHVKEPTPITTFAEGEELGRKNCLEEAHQTHALISGDATPSGESRIQALADFAMASLPFKNDADDAGVWLIETSLCWAAILAGKPGRFNSLRATFDSKLYLGKLTAEERTAIMAEVEKELRSKESARILLGIDDPEAEAEKIAEEQAEANPQQGVNLARARLGLAADQAALNGNANGQRPPVGAGSGSAGGSGAGAAL